MMMLGTPDGPGGGLPPAGPPTPPPWPGGPLTPPPASLQRRRTSSVSHNIRSMVSMVQRYLSEPGSSEGGGSNTVGGGLVSSSPVNKRRGFSGRKWLPPPLRKLSGGKVEKADKEKIAASSASSASDKPVLKKTGSEKRFKIPSVDPSPRSPASADHNGEEAEEEVEVELPPPMKPISEPILVSGASSVDDSQGKRSSSLSIKALEGTSADLAEIEQIVKERMEQHTENQERNSLLNRDSKISNDVSATGSGCEGECETDVGRTDESADSEEIAGASGSGEEDAVLKREYVIKELIETERDYVRDLQLVTEGYMALMRDPDCEIPMPEDLQGGKDKMVFGNLEAIYEWHRDFFLKALERCQVHPEEIGPLFKRYERKLHMYVVYCQNKPVSEYIVSEHDTFFEELRQKLGHKLTLCDLLIKPVQRIMKYQLLLRDIYKYTERAQLINELESLRHATRVMHIVPKSANDMMDVGRLQGFDGKITAQGKLLMHGPLNCTEGNSATANSKSKELQVFLFEQTMIFSEAVGKKTQFTNPVYIHKAHIQVNKMDLNENVDDSDPCKFSVWSTDPKKSPKIAYVCQAISKESRDEWVSTIKNILQTQRDFLKAIQSPIAYQKELTKEVSEWSSLSSRSSKSSIDQGNSDHQSDDDSPVVEEVQSFSYLQGRNLEVHRDSRSEQTRTPSPSKMKLPLLEGFRNTLRARAKSEDIECSKRDLVQALNNGRRWSETKANSGDSSGWKVACVVSDWQAVESGQISLRRGERVRILKHSKNQAFLVQKIRNISSTVEYPSAEEGWVPAHSLAFSSKINVPDEGSRKPWSFKFRKPSFNSGTAGVLKRRFDRLTIDSVVPVQSEDAHEHNGDEEYCISPESPLPKPKILRKLLDTVAVIGNNVQFSCQVTPSCLGMHDLNMLWKRNAAEDNGLSENIVGEGRYDINLSIQGLATLSINACSLTDAGSYSCTFYSVSQANLSVTTSAHLTVVAPSVGRPRAQALSSTSALIVWDGDPTARYTLQYKRYVGKETSDQSADWTSVLGSAGTVLGLSHCIDGLSAGATYIFRVSNGMPSTPLHLSTVTVIEEYYSSRWQLEQFGRRYFEKEVLGRGRYSVIRKAQDRGTGQLVAAKQVSRLRQALDITRAEYSVMIGLQHPSIVRAFALFESSPLPDTDTIIMELVCGPMLLAYACQQEAITEKLVGQYMLQLLSALDYLHSQEVIHFDLRPENILADTSNLDYPVLKLVDFGDCVYHRHSLEIPPPASLEFAAPECVLGQPAGPPSDLWGAAVFLYVFLSGLSPFLDESVEETTANVLKCDYSFPDEFFETISVDAKLLIKKILIIQPSQRITAQDAMNYSWLKRGNLDQHHTIATTRLSSFVERRQASSQTALL